ncbi:MAG: hypothetical protein IKS31_12100 [Clostridia bacterium]|nr:hypothetical protein [Clostridia bacterium]
MNTMKRLTALALALLMTLSVGSAFADRAGINSFLDRVLNAMNGLDLSRQAIHVIVPNTYDGRSNEIWIQQSGSDYCVLATTGGSTVANIRVNDKAITMEAEGQAFSLYFDDIPGIIDTITSMVGGFMGAAGVNVNLDFDSASISESITDLIVTILQASMSATGNSFGYVFRMQLTEEQLASLLYNWLDDVIEHKEAWVKAYTDIAKSAMDLFGQVGGMVGSIPGLGNVMSLVGGFTTPALVRAYWREHKEELRTQITRNTSSGRYVFSLEVSMDQQGNLSAVRFEQEGREQLNCYYEGDTFVVNVDTGYGYQPYYVTADTAGTELKISNRYNTEVGTISLDEAVSGRDMLLSIRSMNGRGDFDTFTVSFGAQTSIPAISNPTRLDSTYLLQMLLGGMGI